MERGFQFFIFVPFSRLQYTGNTGTSTVNLNILFIGFNTKSIFLSSLQVKTEIIYIIIKFVKLKTSEVPLATQREQKEAEEEEPCVSGGHMTRRKKEGRNLSYAIYSQ